MKPFRGCVRRVYLWFPRGRIAHLLSKRRVDIGPISFCGRVGGTEVGWPEVKGMDGICSVCARLSGVAKFLEAA